MKPRRRPVVQYEAGAVFRGYLPEAAVADAVELIWTVDGMPEPSADRVLPNGVVELIINLGDLHRVVHGGSRFTRYRRVWIAGIQNGPLDIASEGSSRLVGIRFRAGGAASVLGVPLCEVTDRVIELEGRIASGFDQLRDQLFEAADDDARVALVETALRARLETRGRPDPRVAMAVRALEAGGEGLRVADLARRLGASHKHLIDLFHRDVGIGPKALARILRFQRLVKSLERAETVRWTDLAYEHGYADQAHLSNEFRALAGVPPSAYPGARTVDPNHLSAGVATHRRVSAG